MCRCTVTEKLESLIVGSGGGTFKNKLAAQMATLLKGRKTSQNSAFVCSESCVIK